MLAHANDDGTKFWLSYSDQLASPALSFFATLANSLDTFKTFRNSKWNVQLMRYYLLIMCA